MKKKYKLLDLNRIILIFLLSLLNTTIYAQSPTIKVDMNMSGRPDAEVLEPGYTPWAADAATSITKTVNGITFTFKKAGSNGTGIRSSWAKADVQIPVNAQLVGDGIYIDGGDAGAQIELTISGLATGTHTFLAYHNAFSTSACAPMDISVNGSLVVNDLKVSSRATKTSDAGMSYLTLNATSGKNIVILYRAETTSSAPLKNVFINAFELNTGNPKKQSRNPVPDDADNHVSGETGSLQLKWEKALDAVSHRVYFSTDESCVTNGTTTSTCYKGSQTATTLNVSGIYTMNTYYWRVDEVDAAGTVTKGAVWSFRPRQLAFPDAEGYGRYAQGGRGGKVVHVTNLNDSGPGSLRYAVENETGPRTIVFDISGMIVSQSRLVLSDPYVTVAGQTAPGKGICIRKAPFGFTGNDVIVRHMRLRLGGGPTYDGMGMTGANNTIMDHCSISWTIDEAFSSRSARNITLQRTLISEALNVAGHQNYPAGTAHGYAGTISGNTGSFHHNLLAHCEGRNFSLGSALDGGGIFASKLDLFNNVVYNFGGRATDGQCHQVNFVNNYYKKGAATKINFTFSMDLENYGSGTIQAYYSGNILQNTNGTFECNGTNNTCGRRYTLTNGNPEPSYNVFPNNGAFFPSYAKIHSAKDAYKSVLSDVGQTQPAFDDHDIRMVNETLTGTYKYKGSKSGKPGLPDNESDVGGYENYPTISRASNWDTDKDGLPDFWETYYGTNKKSAAGDFSDANEDPDKDGYTNLEDYLDWMANMHYFLTYGASQTINLKDAFRGYTASPVYKTTNVVNGTVSISGTTLTFKPSGCGMASFNLVVTDSEGGTMTKKVGVFTESNPAGACVSKNLKVPTVAITQPANNTSKQAPAAFTITATATDADGTIAKVEFFNGATSLGSSIASPYTYTWNNVAAGTYTLTAVATDNDGLKTTSASISLIVTAAPGKFIYNYDNSGNLSWSNTNNWTPKGIPAATDTVIIRNGEVQINALTHTAPVYVEQTATLRMVTASSNVNDIRLQGGTLKVYTSSPELGLTSNITVEKPSTIMAGSVDATVFTLNGTITGSAPLTKTSAGVLRLNSNGSSFKGGWILEEGKLEVLNANALGMCGVLVKNNARLVIGAPSAVSIYSLVIETTGGVDLTQNLNTNVAVFATENILSGSYKNTAYPAYIGGTGTLNVSNSIVASSGATTFCSGNSITLTSSTGTSYIWKNNAIQTGSAAAYTTSISGSYTVDVTNSNGCKVTSAPVTLTGTTQVIPVITSPTTSFCSGGSIVLTASSGSSYKWFNGTTQVGTNATYTATAAGSYTVEVTNAAGCKATSATVTITASMQLTPAVTASATSICPGGSALLSTSGGTSYKWFNSTTQVGIAATYTATDAGSYTVEVTNASGCKATSAPTVITQGAIQSTPVITTTANTICSGGSVLLTVSTGTSYKWFNGTLEVGTASSYTATDAGSYTVEVTNTSGCKATSAPAVIVVGSAQQTPTITSSSTSFCPGESVLLTASAGASYKWLNGTTQVGIAATYTATASGSYTVEVTNASGCKATSAPSTITQGTIQLSPTIASSATSFCSGGSVLLTTSAGTSYKWFNGTTQVETTATYTATDAGSYTVEVTNASGCKATSAPIEITVLTTQLTATITYSATSFCAGASTLLTSSTATSYKWYSGTTLVGTNSTYTATSAGSYTVEVSNASGCTATSTPVEITVTQPETWYADADGDGFGDPAVRVTACEQPSGYVDIDGDNCPLRAENDCQDCAGVLNGTAYMDKCFECVGGNTGITACVITSTANGTSTQIQVIPQPFDNTTTISVKNTGMIQSVTTVSSTGAIAGYRQAIADDEITIGQDLAAGLYLVIVVTDKGTYTTKIIKK